MRSRTCIAAISSLAVLALASTAFAAPVPGLAMFGEPKYGKDFTHFEYANPDAPKGGTVVLSVIGTFDSLNPYILKGSPATGINMVHETLLENAKDEPFSAYGLLAETVDIAPDRSSAQFVLRKEARWHDDTPVTADDVVFSCDILREKGHPSYRSYFRDIKACEKVDARTVRFVFTNPKNRELPLIVGQLPILSKAYYSKVDFTKTTLEAPLGSGPYKVEKADAGRSIRFKRVDNYWGKDLPVNRGRYNFDTIAFEYYRDETVAVEAIKAGKYDMRLENISRIWSTSYTNPAITQGILKKEEIRHELPSGMQGFVINTRKPKFSDVRTREALALAFDFEWANAKLFYGLYSRSNSYFTNSPFASSGLPEGKEKELLEQFKDKIPASIFTTPYAPPVSDGSGHNRENLMKAKTLLEQAGWVIKNNVLVDAKGTPFEIEFLIDTPSFERVFANYVKTLERLGIKARIRMVDSAQNQKRQETFDFDMMVHVFAQSLSPGNEQIDYWHSVRADVQGSRNLANIKDPVVDALIEKIVSANDKEELIAATKALDRVLLAGHYVVPNWHSRVFRIVVWDKFGRPAIAPKYDLGFTDTWWVDAAKQAKVDAYLKR